VRTELTKLNNFSEREGELGLGLALTHIYGNLEGGIDYIE